MSQANESEIGSIKAIGPSAHPPDSKYERLIGRAKGVSAANTIVVHPCDDTSLRGAMEAASAGLIVPTLVGPASKIAAVAQECKLDIAGYEVIDAAHSEAAAAKAVELIREGKGELLVKGSLHTDELMRAVTAAATGLRTERRISHVFVMDVPRYAELSTFPPISTRNATLCKTRSISLLRLASGHRE
jgi:phosphate acetyltransferase